MPGGPAWWAAKTRRVRSHLFRRASEAELRDAAGLLTPAQLAVFRSMHPADQRHGLDVLQSLRSWDADDADLLVAALLHDAGKGPAGLLSRIVYSLAQAYGAWILRLARRVPRLGSALDRLDRHSELSAQLAADAGCSLRTVDLIRQHVAPSADEPLAQLLRSADEAN